MRSALLAVIERQLLGPGFPSGTTCPLADAGSLPLYPVPAVVDFAKRSAAVMAIACSREHTFLADAHDGASGDLPDCALRILERTSQCSDGLNLPSSETYYSW